MQVKVFSAGVAGEIAQRAAEMLEQQQKDMQCEVVIGGSVEGIQRIKSGEDFDVMILADNTGIEKQLMPEYTEGYYIWGGNSMVIMGKGITDDNWKETLLDPNAQIVHSNPYNDPSGYRAVMAMMLADQVEPGLSDKLLHHPNYHGLEKEQYAGGHRLPEIPQEGTYRITYRSNALSMEAEFAQLPIAMNQGDSECDELYGTVSFETEDGETVFGNMILHGILVAKNTKNREGAEAFVKSFLSNRFMRYGFSPVQGRIGKWEIELPDMWKREGGNYYLLSSMEVNETNRQLDSIPLSPEDVLLDCGCGGGRLAVQAAKRVKKVICLDTSKSMMERCKDNCRQAGVTNVEFILADWQDAEIANVVPEVDVIVQARGCGGPSALSLLKKVARKYAVNISQVQGGANMSVTRKLLFNGCYAKDTIEKYPQLKGLENIVTNPQEVMKRAENLAGMKLSADMKGKVPMGGTKMTEYLKKQGIESHVTRVEGGWERVFESRQEAYDWFIQLADYPELLDEARFHQNIDSLLTEQEGGYLFHLPTISEVTWFKTR